MKNYLYLALLVSLSFACNTNKKSAIISPSNYETYAFKIQGHSWDTMPYRFSQYIQDSVLKEKGNQVTAWDYSYIGDIQKMHETWDIGASPYDSLTQEEINNFKKYKAKNAFEYIIEQAKSHQVTIINEGHHMPQHRVFTTRLLEDLYAQGYRHLGMESYFTNNRLDSLLAINKQPMLQSGYYIKEPQFGNIVRQAYRIGYNVFGYESEGHSNGKEREIGQANNINKYIEENPEGKVLLHCGFAHGAEGEYGGSWERTMAARLTEFTGIDPLTITQTKYSEKSEFRLENPYYQLVDVIEPTIYVDDSETVFGRNFREGSYFDIAVFHPRSKENRRPAWMLFNSRQIHEFDFSNAEIEFPCLVLAYLEGEDIGKAVPYDIQESLDRKAKLVLEEGSYNIILWNEANQALRIKYRAE